MNIDLNNPETSGVSYLGLMPNFAQKSNYLPKMLSNKPVYYKYEGNDYDLPDNQYMDKKNNTPRFDVNHINPTHFTVENKAKYRNILNKNHAEQTDLNPLQV